ncbi:MAG: hypothetical protein Q7R63_00310 [bacterium]|nr:hypothetical protein [bacterium]
MSPSNRTNKRTGFALFEFVIYCGLLIAVLTALVTAATHAFMEKKRLAQLESIERTGRIATSVIAQEIQSAASLGSPLGNATSGILTLHFATGTPSTSFSLTEGRLILTKGGLAPRQVTEAGITVGALEFKGSTDANTYGVIHTSFTVSNGPLLKTFTLFNTIYAH